MTKGSSPKMRSIKSEDPLRPGSSDKGVGWACGKTKIESRTEYYNVICKVNRYKKNQRKFRYTN